MKNAIFLDRDGVLNKDTNLIHKKEDIIILPKVKEALELLKKDFLLIVITNQPVIARGLITEKGIEEINNNLNSQLDNLINKFYFCPHHPNADLIEFRKICDCRKPSSGMILKAKDDFNIDLKNSWMIGDMPSDIACGKNAGVKTILTKSENNNKIIESDKKFDGSKPDHIFDDLYKAAKFIVKKDQ